MSKALFLFHRDLRLKDNTGLIAALQSEHQVVPLFILDPVQISQTNEYRSDHALQFMAATLQELDVELQEHGSNLYVFVGATDKVLASLFQNESISAFFTNRDYTPFAVKRDEKIKQLCVRHNVAYHVHNDYLLTEPEGMQTNSGTPYQIFTPFYKKALLYDVPQPTRARSYEQLYRGDLAGAVSGEGALKMLIKKPNRQLQVKGGKKEGERLLGKVKNLKRYKKTRDYPSEETSHLSAHIKFGTVSIREVYWKIKKILDTSSELLKQLYWRDFFTHVAYHSPFVFGSSYHKKYNAISWSRNKKNFQKWCDGVTGFPIIDAGMRQLNQTGYMHNRARMLVASFLIKDLHIDWRWGEKYFATKLVDYDPAVNNGNWQWVASTGCDAQPYFRIFNPWLQQKKYDPDCAYIKKWIPELANLTAKEIHNWHERGKKHPDIDYPLPMVDHAMEAQITKEWFSRVG